MGSAETQTEREDLYELLIRYVQEFAIFLLDPDGRILTWNEGARRLFEYTRDEIVGQPLARLYTSEDVAQDSGELPEGRLLQRGSVTL